VALFAGLLLRVALHHNGCQRNWRRAVRPRMGSACTRTEVLCVARGLLDELHARRQAQFGVDVVEVGLHRAW
jgi:hypothetical protein